MSPQQINFGYLPEEHCSFDNASIVILPVAYDGTSTWVKGADKGTQAIIDASANMELYDIETDSEVYNDGIYTEDPLKNFTSPEDMVQAVRELVSDYLAVDKFTVVIGGEHSVSIGSIGAHVKRFPGMCVLHLDAHADLRDKYNGSKYNHACVMARAREKCPIVQVGIRSMDVSEKQNMDRERVFLASDIAEGVEWIDKVVEMLCDDVYITIDLDVFDPSIMPSTGTPEPGGLGWYPALKLLRTVAEKKNIVGFDVVELCPNIDDKAPDFLAAKLIYKLLSYVFRGRNE